MRKFFSSLLVFLLLFVPIVSNAAQVPLELQGKSVYIPEETDIELVSYNAFFRIRTGFLSGNTSMVIRNNNSESKVKFQMGFPGQIDYISNIKDLVMTSNGQKLKLIKRNSLKNPPSEKVVPINSWYVCDVSLEPGETKLIESSFAFDNKLELDGTEVLSFPLTLLENWSGGIKNLQVVADLDYYPPYSFDPMPSIPPFQYDNDGRLTFKFNNVHSLPGDLDLSFKPMDLVITRYIESNSDSNKEIREIMDTYNIKNYDKTISSIDEYLSGQEDLMIKEIKYIKGLCYQHLYDLDKALTIFDELEKDPGFGTSLSQTIKNKIIYDKFSILKTQSDDEKALDYLLSKQDLVINNDIFVSWMDKEILLLTPPVIEEIPEEIVPEPEEEEEEEIVVEDEPNTIGKISIGDREFFIEEIIIVLVVLLIIIFIITRIVKKRKRRRSSIFRY